MEKKTIVLQKGLNPAMWFEQMYEILYFISAISGFHTVHTLL